mgnify:CR=1 FL=1
MMIETIKIEEDARLPQYAHASDAGADLFSCEDITLYPGERHAVRTGIAINIPDGYVGFITPRSGLAAKNGVTVLNAPGTIDAGFQGELKVILINTDLYMPHEIKHGDKIAQIVFQKIKHGEFIRVDNFPNKTERGSGGFGSTGS